MHFSTSLLGVASLALIISSAQAQVLPPTANDKINVTYVNDGNGVIATEEVPFNTCFASETAFTKYSYVNFAPNNATINFYKDSNCKTFAFGLDGYYGGYPGPARSYRWVGWSMDSLGVLFNKNPIQGQGDAAGGDPATVPGGKIPDGGNNTPATPPPTPNTGDNTNKDQTGGNTADESTSGSTKTSSSSTFFGGVVGSLVVLSVGGVIFWKTAGKKLIEDKGKGVLPYNRVGRDGDILLTNSNRGHNSFEIGDEDDDEDEDEVDTRRQHRSGRQERYHDDDQA
ncbi:hypothetical protein BGX28_005211 [Mortierella sp. GBA30]|nr:hypothetical protein BGX28_005211 [Mortierella sp. GBA30]